MGCQIAPGLVWSQRMGKDIEKEPQRTAQNSLVTIRILNRILEDKFAIERINRMYSVQRPEAIDKRNKLILLRERIIEHFSSPKS